MQKAKVKKKREMIGVFKHLQKGFDEGKFTSIAQAARQKNEDKVNKDYQRLDKENEMMKQQKQKPKIKEIKE